MAQKEGVELTRKQVSSMPKKKLITPKAASKAKSPTASISAKNPGLFYSHVILPAGLRAAIDEKWSACWPVSTLKPLALVDLLCYLLFIKKLEERQLITVALTRLSGDNCAPPNELNWSGFKDMDAQDLHRLFTDENGVPDLIKNYGLTNLQYSVFLKEPLLLTPTPRLLLNMVGIIKIMDAEQSDTKAAMFEYLLNKAEIEAQNGQVYAPDKVVKLIIELMQPTPNDLILDPSTGNGSLLVNSAMYLRIKNAGGGNNFNNDYFGNIYKGIECDPIQLRIGAMNMILHGIEDPKLESIDVFSNAHVRVVEQPTLVLSNLFFNGSCDKKAMDGKTSPAESGRCEIRFLNLVLKTLKKGGKAAVIVPEYILSNFGTEIITIRRQMIDDLKMEAVISLTAKSDSLFPGACILIFSEGKAGINDKVWFYKMKPWIKRKETDSTGKMGKQEYLEECREMTDIINRWKNVKRENTRVRTDNSFYVPIDEIRTHNYSLCFNEYRKIEQITQPDTPGIIPIIDKGIIAHISTKRKVRLNFARIKLPGHIPPFTKGFSLKLPEHVHPAIKGFSLRLPEQLRMAVRRISLKLPTHVLPAIKGISLKLTQQLRVAVRRFSLKLPERIPFISESSLKLRDRLQSGAKRFSLYLDPLTLIAVIIMFFYFVVFTNKNDIIATTKTNHVPGSEPKEGMHKLVIDASAPAILSREQIKALVYDTTPVIHFDEQPADVASSLKDSAEESATYENDDIVTSNSLNETREPVTFKNALPAKYTVRDTTFFHDQPDEHSVRKTYLDPLNNNVLNPIHDKNGFIYIVYTNHFGRTSKGWINKKDLMPLQ